MPVDPQNLTALLAQLERGFGRAGGSAGAERGTGGQSGLADALALLGQFQSLDRRDLTEPPDEGSGSEGRPAQRPGQVSSERIQALRSRLDGLLSRTPGGEDD